MSTLIHRHEYNCRLVQPPRFGCSRGRRGGEATSKGRRSHPRYVRPNKNKNEERMYQRVPLIGKANQAEFAGMRGQPHGWSGRGGQCTNAYFPNADACGSSSGSAVAAFIGLAAVTLGSETDGSITCPASHNNLAGIKPTLGLISRAGGQYAFLFCSVFGEGIR
jgi:hypothetical protein